jgi:hypothetical protein
VDSYQVSKLEERLANRLVRVWLLADGKSSLRELFEGKVVFSAHVETVHDLGIWLRVASKQTSGSGRLDAVVLLKWGYIAALQVQLEDNVEPLRVSAERLQ